MFWFLGCKGPVPGIKPVRGSSRPEEPEGIMEQLLQGQGFCCSRVIEGYLDLMSCSTHQPGGDRTAEEEEDEEEVCVCDWL